MNTTIIKPESELVAQKLNIQIVAAILVCIAGSFAIKEITDSVWVHAAADFAISASPLFGLLIILDQLPKRVSKFVQTKIPEHIEFVDTKRLSLEVIIRGPALVAYQDPKEGIRLYESYTRVGNQAELYMFMSSIAAWGPLAGDLIKSRLEDES